MNATGIHHVRAADDHRLASGDRDVVPEEHLDRGVGGGGEEAAEAEPEEAGVHRVDPVDVLGRVDRVDHRAKADTRREGHLDDDPGDVRVHVEVADRRGDAGLRGALVGFVPLDLDESAADPGRIAGPQDLAKVDRRWRVAPDEDDGQRGGVAAAGDERGDVAANRLAKHRRDRGARRDAHRSVVGVTA